MAWQGQVTSRHHEIGIHRSERGTSSPSRISARTLCALLPGFDALLLLASAVVAYAIKLAGDPYSDWDQYALVAVLGTLLALNVFHFAGLYESSILTRPGTAVRRAAIGWFGVSASLVAIAFLTKTSEDYSRGWALIWLGLGLASTIALRVLFFHQATRWIAQGRLQSRIALLGPMPLARQIKEWLSSRPTSGLRIAGIFSDTDLASATTGKRYDGDLDDLIDQIRDENIDAVLVTLPSTARRRFERIVNRLGDCPVDVRYCPGPVALELAERGVTHYAGAPTLNVLERPLSGWRAALKEVEDRILGLLILLMISPVLLVIAALIKLDSPGPVFFRQKRFGLNNHLIEVLKFRTMRQDMSDQDAASLTRRNDPRITPLGALLRRWSLDELPQFINVVLGEMSIVGPRPHALLAKAGGLLYYDAVPHYDARHRVKPGITGWAQINGWRGTTDTVDQIRKRVEFDLYYIENWSLWLDLKIIALTAFKGFRSEHAY